MKTYTRHLLFFVIVIAVTGCNKYLDVSPKGYTLLTTVPEYDQWLADPVLLNDGMSGDVLVLQDNIDNPSILTGSVLPADLAYQWAPQFVQDVNSAPVWSTGYRYIYAYNTLLNGIERATGGTPKQASSLYAEALLGRAYTYLSLINLYGKYYDSTTAASDLAVPFVTSEDIAKPIPERATVAELYTLILSDLEKALPDLPQSNAANRYRGSVSACYSVMARTYYYMNNWAQARKNAQLALTSDPSLSMVDYNTIADPSVFSPNQTSPDNIYVRNCNPTSLQLSSVTTPTLSFLQSFNPNDLRLPLFYATIMNGVRTAPGKVFNTRGKVVFTGYGTLTFSTNRYSTNSGTSVSEMKLIIAEAAARLDDPATALQQLNEVRKNRIAASAYTDYQSNYKDSIIEKIAKERSFEFAFNGLRWFDMRKLDKQGSMPEINRYGGSGNIIASLPPHSNRYVLQLPLSVIFFNPNMPQNP